MVVEIYQIDFHGYRTFQSKISQPQLFNHETLILPHGVEKLMVEWSVVKKSGVEMSCYLLESGRFNPRPFNHEYFKPIGVLGGGVHG